MGSWWEVTASKDSIITVCKTLLDPFHTLHEHHAETMGALKAISGTENLDVQIQVEGQPAKRVGILFGRLRNYGFLGIEFVN
jgi:hypothetical protein